eukprot:9120860-Heterocapsa_arctica.AAC.1
MFRAAHRDASVQVSVARMLNPTRETGTQDSPNTTATGVGPGPGQVTVYYDAEDHPHFKDYMAEIELQQDMEIAARQALALQTKEKRESMRQ